MKADENMLDDLIRELKATPPRLNAPTLLTEAILSKLPESNIKTGRMHRLYTLSLNAAAIFLFVFFCLEQLPNQPGSNTRINPTNAQYSINDAGKSKQLTYMQKMQQNREKNEAFQKTYKLFKNNAL